MHKIFAYGTLTKPAILESILGRVPTMADDELQNYSISSYNEYLNLTYNQTSKVYGKVFEVDDKELKLIDKYEGFEYSRIGRKLKSGTTANVYLVLMHKPIFPEEKA